VLVWLITLRGFGLDTGLIRYGDLQLHTLQLQWTLSTRSSLDPTDGTVLRRRLTSRTDHFWLRRLTDDDSHTHWRRLTDCDPRDWLTTTHSRTGVDWLTLNPKTDWLTVVYCLPLTTSGCPNGNTGLTTVGYHSNQHWPYYRWLP
jgi:hypothetical protein